MPSPDMSTVTEASRNETRGPGPTPEKFASAVAQLEARGEKLTVRAIEAIAGGTRAVTTRLLREYRHQQIVRLEEQNLPGDFLDAGKHMLLRARQAADRDWQQRYQAALDAQAELETMLAESEGRRADLEAALEQARIGEAAHERMWQQEQHLHEATRAELQSSREAVTKAGEMAAEKHGELMGSYSSLMRCEQLLEQRIRRVAQLEGYLDELVQVLKSMGWPGCPPHGRGSAVAKTSHARAESETDVLLDTEMTMPNSTVIGRDQSELPDSIPPSDNVARTPQSGGRVAEGRPGAGTASDVTEGTPKGVPDGAAVAGTDTGPSGVSRT